MDLILLEPGNQAIFGADSWQQGGSPGDNPWRDSMDGFGQCIELVSLRQGMKQQVTTDVSNSAHTPGRPIVTEFTLVKYVDRISVKFYEYCLRAEPLGKGKDQPTKLHIARNSGNGTASILTILLRDAVISEIELQSHPSDMPTEQFKLHFTEILWRHACQAGKAATAGETVTGWSIARNRPITQFTD